MELPPVVACPTPTSTPLDAIPAAPECALDALRKSLMKVASLPKFSNKIIKIPVHSTAPSLSYPVAAITAAYPDVPRSRRIPIDKKVKLIQLWSAKKVYAATLSLHINELSHIHLDATRALLHPIWCLFAEKLGYLKVHGEESEWKQVMVDETIDAVFDETGPVAFEAMRSLSGKNAHSVTVFAVLKGITDSVAAFMVDVMDSTPTCDSSRIQHQFEDILLSKWKTLIMESNSDLREAAQRYLQDDVFRPLFDCQKVFDGSFVEEDQRSLIKLRTEEEQQAFMESTKRYLDQMDSTLDRSKNITVLGTYSKPMQWIEMMANRTKRVRNVAEMAEEIEMEETARPKKKRRYTTYQLFREDGTPRKTQVNPNYRRRCKRMWQADGISRGCGQNSHRMFHSFFDDNCFSVHCSCVVELPQPAEYVPVGRSWILRRRTGKMEPFKNG